MPPEPLLLAFDTSAAHCAAALRRGERLIARRHEEMSRGQAERLMPMLEEMLAQAGHAWRDLAAIGVGTGPGNFTGIRIAVSAARGLSLALGVPAIGVSGFDILARGAEAPALLMLPAPRDHVHAARLLEGGALSPPRHMAREAALALAEAEGLIPLGPEAVHDAAAIAGIAAQRFASGTTAERPRPLYIRKADAAPPRERPLRILP